MSLNTLKNTNRDTVTKDISGLSTLTSLLQLTIYHDNKTKVHNYELIIIIIIIIIIITIIITTTTPKNKHINTINICAVFSLARHD